MAAVNASILTVGDVCRAIDQLAVGEFAPFCGRLVGPDDARPSVSAEDLLDARMSEAIRKRFARRFADFDGRAVYSIWVKWYLFGFLPPVLLADLLLARRLTIALDKIRFVIGDDERVAAVVMGDVGEDATGADRFTRFEAMVFGHFTPLIEHLSVRTGLTRRLLWSNVGNTFEAMLRKVEEVSGAGVRLDEAQRLMTDATWPDGRRNPLRDAVRYTSGNGTRNRRRRICCLQYMLPDRRFCSACPVPAAGTTASDLVVID